MNYKRIGDVLTLLIPAITAVMAWYISYLDLAKFIFAYIVVATITWIGKSVFYAYRPNANQGDSIRLKWSVNDGESFPSGHTSSAMAGAVYALFLYWPVGLVLVVLAFVCAWTRVKVKAHFWRDVFFGSVAAQIGCGIVFWNLLNSTRWIEKLMGYL